MDTPASRPPGRRYRVVAVTAGVLVAANLLILGAVWQRTTDPDPSTPVEIADRRPGPGDVVLGQSPIGAALVAPPLRAGTLEIDGREIPEDQIELRQQGSSVWILFQPGEGKEFEQLRPGAHDVVVVWWEDRGQLDDRTRAERRGEISRHRWSFTVE